MKREQGAKDKTVIATVSVSQGRRLLTVVPGGIAGAMLVWYKPNAFSSCPPANVLIIGMDELILIGALWISGNSTRRVELMESDLRDSSGNLNSKLAPIKQFGHRTISYRAAQDFVLELDVKTPAYGHPRLWWCLGSRVSVGGLSCADEAK